jgi:hypothetical protein
MEFKKRFERENAEVSVSVARPGLVVSFKVVRVVIIGMKRTICGI